MTKLDDLKNKLRINDLLTKPIKKDKNKTKISDVVTLIEDYNLMADLLYLPTTEEKYKYLLVIVDLATHEFDMEPLKTKESTEVAKAMKTIFKRNYVKKPEATIRTDNGTEFKGAVDKYLKSEDIFHSVSMPYRHQQLSMVESLNKTLGTLFMEYLNYIELQTKKKYREWTDVVDVIRVELNKIRKVKAPYTEKTIFNFKDSKVKLSDKPKYKIGDLVHYKLAYPEDSFGNKQATAQFRQGDYRFSPLPKKIKNIFYYSGQVPYRYQLEDMDYVSFPESELKHSIIGEQKWFVKKIINKKKEKNKIYYLTWWKGYKKSESTWEPKTELLKDGLADYIEEYEQSQ